MLVYDQISSNVAKTWLWMTVFFVMIIGLGWVFGQVYDAPGFVIGAAVFSTVGSIVSYWFSDSIVLGLAGAKEITEKRQFPELFRIVENLCIAAGLPMPRLYVIDEEMPNAFATGRDPRHAAIAVTRGLLEILDKDELEGVLAHELSHVGNRDSLLMTAVVILAGLVSVISNMFLRMQWFGFGRRRDDREGGEAQSILFLVGLVFALLAPIGAALIQLAISRKREFLADANAMLITRYPDGLIAALKKLKKTAAIAPTTNTAIDHLYFASPFGADKKNGEGEQGAPWYATLFSTHPSLDQRIAVLEKMK